MDIGYLVLVFAFMGLSALVGWQLRRKFEEYSHIPVAYTGKEIAEKMLRDNQIFDVQVISVAGQLTDHYNPSDKTVNLSESVFYNNSVAAAAVAAHECGHAVQHATAYNFLTLRSSLVPIVNIASKISSVVFGIGIGVFFLQKITIILWIGIIALAITALFAVVTLPVEFDASARALKWLDQSQTLRGEAYNKAKNALTWAALTYVVAALNAIAQVAYFLLKAMNRRSDD